MLPIQIFTYPNGKKGVCIYKTGYTSTSYIFSGEKKQSFFNSRKDFKDFGHIYRSGIDEPLLFPFRDPVKRFVSAMKQLKKNKKYAEYDIDSLLDGLEQGTFKNPHFLESSIILRNACFIFHHIHLYKFPEHYEQMLRDGGYEGNIPHENKSSEKLTLTKMQEERVKKYYAKDIEMFESIEKPGQEFYFLKI